MAVLKQISTGKIVASGIHSMQSAKEVAELAGYADGDYEVVYSEEEITQSRLFEYKEKSDHLFIDYMANLTELGDNAQATIDAKQAWLDARASVKASFPKS
ncbi:hypothetical protein A7985_22470 [Pseudoalteromonas luteoviolacea]|uniref:Uncharacterized protein n=1 Tax=Pseudoalteromonas luteoviolacea TaxID=43657 RepID=A0A1C0TK92_9GAMM|nr:hypothetical protein [Pseudoalteromonas luteoviolacea]OCQ18952.1 hypothetical protein A7985_22470 [Pseudoalteromonas luteoviolacea]